MNETMAITEKQTRFDFAYSELTAITDRLDKDLDELSSYVYQFSHPVLGSDLDENGAKEVPYPRADDKLTRFENAVERLKIISSRLDALRLHVYKTI